MLQCSTSSLPRKTLQDLDAALERAQFAVRELGHTAFERTVGSRRPVHVLAPGFGHAQRQPAAVVRILGTLDQAAADQRVNSAANGGSPTPHLGRDLVQ